MSSGDQMSPDYDRLDEMKARIEKLEAFKKYVHERLDAANVPHNPEPEANTKHGCRVEGRLNWLEGQLAKAKAEASDWSKHWGQLDRERTSLKGRITSLRRALKAENHLVALDYDHLRRRRFEKKEKKR